MLNSIVSTLWPLALRRFSRSAFTMPDFKIQAAFKPTGDQPRAIEDLTRGLNDGLRHQTLLGVTGSGKTFTMAGIIENTQRPALAIFSGILAGVAASIDGLIERYQDVAGVNPGEVRVVLTGGDGSRISPHLRHLHQIIPNLVCRGVLDLPRSLVGQTSIHKELG